ncbi:hypothetical protein [Clostridium sp. DJ247]|uniref:P-type ATPase n=1 Tax=Clostridium sp. DJ247 TaxID=2726188 RepID=UPI001625866A|nr:hypothetical protein [Clostridium sp. DJ247]MBC2579917.1 hypothetical protein [Clostridium sp. DJ247]
MSINKNKEFFVNIFTNFVNTGINKRKKVMKRLDNIEEYAEVKLLDRHGNIRRINANDVRNGDIILVEVGDIIPRDGEIIEGLAFIDESAITGESVPVIKDSSKDFSSVTSGTKVVSNWLKIKITKKHEESFISRMLSIVDSSKTRIS